MYGQYVHNESYKTLDVTGEMKTLTIIGEDRTNTVIEAKKENINKANFDVATRRRKLMVEFAESKMDFIIRVPKDVNLVIKPYDIVFEGMFDLQRDKRKITIENMKGSIDIATDGYEVDLVGSNNNISVVSYLDIFADSIEMIQGGSISMDSYWGDVLLRPIPPIDAQITMRANQGIVKIDSLIKIAEERSLFANNRAIIVGEGTSAIMLHSEKGARVFLEMQEELDVQMRELEKEIEILDQTLIELDDNLGIINTLVEQHELFQNSPNPWRESTSIPYVLHEDKEVEFKFVDIENNVVYSVIEQGKEGMNTLKISKDDISKTGVIYYSMKIGDVIYTKKMVHLDN